MPAWRNPGRRHAAGRRADLPVARALTLPDIREKLLALGADPVGSTAQELIAAMRVDSERYGAVIKRLGIRAD